MADNDLSETLSALFSNPESMSKLQGLIRTLSSGNAASSAPSAQPESTNQLQGLINMLSSGNAAPSAPSAQSETPSSSAPPDQPMQSGTEEASNSGGLPFDPSLLLKLQQAMSLVRQDDPRVAFLVALKPNLSERRRQRVDEAVRMLRLVHLVPFLREQHFL